MNVLDYQFPKVRPVDLAFPTFDTPAPLLKKAKDQGFYNGSTPANTLFNTWFFKGLKLKEGLDLRDDVDEAKAQKAMNWAVCYMGSFAPKHEEKEAVCALIFDACLKIPTTAS